MPGPPPNTGSTIRRCNGNPGVAGKFCRRRNLPNVGNRIRAQTLGIVLSHGTNGGAGPAVFEPGPPGAFLDIGHDHVGMGLARPADLKSPGDTARDKRDERYLDAIRFKRQLPPQTLKPMPGNAGVMGDVLGVAVTQVVLHSSCISALVGHRGKARLGAGRPRSWDCRSTSSWPTRQCAARSDGIPLCSRRCATPDHSGSRQ